jgi:hypothetical protein
LQCILITSTAETITCGCIRLSDSICDNRNDRKANGHAPSSDAGASGKLDHAVYSRVIVRHQRA